MATPNKNIARNIWKTVGTEVNLQWAQKDITEKTAELTSN